MHFLHVNGVKKPVPFYNLDVIITMGYRVKSKRRSMCMDSKRDFVILRRTFGGMEKREYLCKGKRINYITMKSFYRLVNPLFEQEGKEYDTINSAVSPRIQRTIQLSPIFNIVFLFWQRTGVQLSTAIDAILKFPDYLEAVKSIERSKRENVPTFLFNHHETISNVPFIDVKTLMLSYYDLYNEKGVSLGVDDLQYIWDFLWETVRKNMYINKTSRFLCLFLYDNPDQAKALQNEIDPLHQNIVVKVMLEGLDGIERYDAGWLDLISVDCTFNEYIDYCRSYWEGKESECPNWEYLYVGRYRIKYIN